MTFGGSILLLAVGAILRFAVHVSTTGFNLHTVGVILMIAGAVGLILSFFWVFMWSDHRETRNYEERERPRQPPQPY